MAAQTTNILKSKTIWGSFISLLPVLYAQLPDIISEVVPVLPPHVASIVTAVGGVLAIIGRLNPEIKPIK